MGSACEQYVPTLETAGHGHGLVLAPGVLSGAQNSDWQDEGSPEVLSCPMPLQGSATSLWPTICLLAVWFGEQPSLTSALAYNMHYKIPSPAQEGSPQRRCSALAAEPELMPGWENSGHNVRDLYHVCAFYFLTQILFSGFIFLFSGDFPTL